MFGFNFQHPSYLESLATTLMSTSGRCLETFSWLGKQVVELPETASAGCKSVVNTAMRCGKLADAIYRTPLCQYPKYFTQSGLALWYLVRDRNYKDMSEYVAARIPEIAGGVRQVLIGADWCAEKMLGFPLVPLNVLNASDAVACTSGAGRLTCSVLDRLHTLTPFEKLGLIHSVVVAAVSGTRLYVHSDHNPLEVCTAEDQFLWYLECASGVISTAYYTCVVYKHRERLCNWVGNAAPESKQLLVKLSGFPRKVEAKQLA